MEQSKKYNLAGFMKELALRFNAEEFFKDLMARGLDADFAFTPGQTWDIGDGKTYYCHADARLLRK